MWLLLVLGLLYAPLLACCCCVGRVVVVYFTLWLLYCCRVVALLICHCICKDVVVIVDVDLLMRSGCFQCLCCVGLLLSV